LAAIAVLACAGAFAPAAAEEPGAKPAPPREAREPGAKPPPPREAKEPPPYIFQIEGVVIEADWLKPEPTIEEQVRKTLDVPQYLVPEERVLADGAIEVRTRVGRFCSNPLPSYITSGMIGALPPILPCFSF
jgi:hypothetical protein